MINPSGSSNNRFSLLGIGSAFRWLIYLSRNFLKSSSPKSFLNLLLLRAKNLHCTLQRLKRLQLYAGCSMKNNWLDQYESGFAYTQVCPRRTDGIVSRIIFRSFTNIFLPERVKLDGQGSIRDPPLITVLDCYWIKILFYSDDRSTTRSFDYLEPELYHSFTGRVEAMKCLIQIRKNTTSPALEFQCPEQHRKINCSPWTKNLIQSFLD